MTAGRPRAALLSIAVVLVGCGLLPEVGNDRIHVLNSSTIPVTLVVNGRQIAAIQPNASAEVGPAELGSMPWHAAVQIAGGRELLTIDVEPDSVQDIRNPDGSGSYSAPATRVDLSCGQIRLYAGRLMPGGPAPGPGTPGDCDLQRLTR